MKTQLLGVGVSLTVHAIVALLLFIISQGVCPESRPLALDLRFDVSSLTGKPGIQMEGAHLPDESAMPEGPTKAANESSSEPTPLERPERQPVMPDPPPKFQALKKEKPRPVPQPPPLAPDLTKPESIRVEKDPVDPLEQMASTPPPEKNSETRLRQPTAGQAGSGGEALSGAAGETSAGKAGNTMNNGGANYLNTNVGLIRRRLRKSLCYPTIARQRGWSGKVLIAFTIYPDGLVDNLEIKKSCGISLLDKSALATIRNATPFPKPPKTLRIKLPIHYQLN